MTKCDGCQPLPTSRVIHHPRSRRARALRGAAASESVRCRARRGPVLAEVLGVHVAVVVLALQPDHVQHRVDQGQVGEGLREVAQVLAGVGVDLLAVQVERSGEGQQLGAQLAGPVVLTDLAQRRHQPERADRERPLLALEAVVGLLHLVAQHQPVHGQLVGDGQHGGPDPRVVGGQEPEQRREQQRGVQGLGAVVLGEHAALVHPVGEDVLLDLLGRQLPLVGLGLLAAQPGQLGAPVDRHPAHDLRRGEVLAARRGPPRCPASGSRQCFSASFTCLSRMGQIRPSRWSAALACR